VLYPLKKVIQKKRERELVAAKLYEKNLKKSCFEALNEGITMIRIEQNVQISKDLEKAKLHYEHSLKTFFFFTNFFKL